MYVYLYIGSKYMYCSIDKLSLHCITRLIRTEIFFFSIHCIAWLIRIKDRYSEIWMYFSQAIYMELDEFA
jgi:hypothetical protein